MTISLKRFDLKTKQGKLFQALVMNRETLTEAQIAHRFGRFGNTLLVESVKNTESRLHELI